MVNGHDEVVVTDQVAPVAGGSDDQYKFSIFTFPNFIFLGTCYLYSGIEQI